jgi:choline kinase
MKAVIVAAGMGSRLNHDVPKTLLPLGNGTILSNILKNISQAGMRDFVIVIGYQGDDIKNYLKERNYLGNNICFVENLEWQRGNGISVLAAEQEVSQERFLLSMSDHIVSATAIERVIHYNSPANLLLVDPKVDNIFDLDDATKVETKGAKITNIGKEIANYNGIDCGIFKLTHRFFDSMRESLKLNQESISASVKGLIANSDMEAVFMQPGEFWIDIDTPESYEFALKNQKRIEWKF